MFHRASSTGIKRKEKSSDEDSDEDYDDDGMSLDEDCSGDERRKQSKCC
jgi:hypothetical protein